MLNASEQKERGEKHQKMNIHIHPNEGERKTEETREQSGSRDRGGGQGRVPQSCLALVAWAKEGRPSTPDPFPHPASGSLPLRVATLLPPAQQGSSPGSVSLGPGQPVSGV